MRIGIDMDNTICSTLEKVAEYQTIYMQEENLSFDSLWNIQSNKDRFLKKYLKIVYQEVEIKNNAREAIKKLKELKHEIYIITARSEKYVSNIYKVTNECCKKNNIPVDKIITHGEDKVDACLDNDVDIMIEDSKYNFDRLTENNINAILFDEKDEYKEIENRINSWQEIPKLLKLINK